MGKYLNVNIKMDEASISKVFGKMVNAAKRSTRAARHRMEDGAKDIRDLARNYAPVDMGNLENAIKIGHEKGEKGRRIFVVYVDEAMTGKNGRSLSYYAKPMHEGTYTPSKKSESKGESLGIGINKPGSLEGVGRKYLERAFLKMEDEIERKLADAYRRELK
jgi:hypothetical protein